MQTVMKVPKLTMYSDGAASERRLLGMSRRGPAAAILPAERASSNPETRLLFTNLTTRISKSTQLNFPTSIFSTH